MTPREHVPHLDGDVIYRDERADLTEEEKDRLRWVEQPAEADTHDLGVILPEHDRPPAERLVLIDWDDVRDPETGEIRPVCTEFLRRVGAYAEVSQSGEVIHQFVFGALPEGFQNFIEAIDDEPFIDGEEDLPAVEIYDGKRFTAMTGQHVAGTGEDVVDGQDAIADLIDRFNTRTVTPGESAEYDEGEGSSGSGGVGGAPYDGPGLDAIDLSDDRPDLLTRSPSASISSKLLTVASSSVLNVP